MFSFGKKGKKDEPETELDEDGNPIATETLGDAFRQYVAYCTGEEKYEKNFTTDDIWPALRSIYWAQRRQVIIDRGLNGFKMDLSNVKEYYEPASDALLAICKGHGTRPYMVVDLLMQGADPNVMEERTENRPIHFLCRRGCYMGVKYLIQAGADYFALNAGHRNALLAATDTSRTGEQVRLVRYLLSLPGYIYKLEVRDSGNNTAAINAIFKQNVWILRELLKAGARVTDDHLLDPGQASAFHIAQWIYAASILSDIDQLPPVALKDLDYEQKNFFYRWTSPKGHYKYAPILALQTIWHYGQELCYRMCMHKKIREDREPPLARQVTEVKQMADDMATKRKARKLAKEVKAAKKAAKAKKLVGRVLGNQVRELEEWNKVREAMALSIDQKFSQHLKGKEVRSTMEWVQKENLESKDAIKSEHDKVIARHGIEWEERVKACRTYITGAPPLPKTKFTKIKLDKMLEEAHNRTHDLKHRINITCSPEEFYLGESWVKRDQPKDPDKIVPAHLNKPYATNKTEDGVKWRLAERTDMGLVDPESKWATMKMTTPLVVPPVSDSSDEDSDFDYEDVSLTGNSEEQKAAVTPAKIKPIPSLNMSFSAPKDGMGDVSPL